MEKRAAEENGHGANGDTNGKRAKLDPDCGRLLFCGTTEWEKVLKPGVLKTEHNWSKNNIYEPTILAKLKDVRIRHLGSGIEAGHCVIVDETGQAWSWGNNESGQLGHGDTRHRRVPTPVKGTGPGGETIVMVALGSMHTVMLTAKGDVLTCGNNEDGRCGQGEMKTKKVPGKGSEDVEICNVEKVVRPEKINYEGPPVVQVSSGTDFSMLMDVTGTVWTFGSQEFGQCGTGSDGAYNAANASVKMKYAGISVPFKITRAVEKDPKTKKLKSMNIGKIKMISAGAHHAAALDGAGRVFMWGSGSYGRTGLGDTLDALSPTFLSALDHPRGKVESIYCGYMMTVMPAQTAGIMYMAGLLDNVKKEANMTPKPYFDIIDQGVFKDIGFWQKGFSVVTEEGGVAVANTGNTYGELGMGERIRTQGQPKKLKNLEYANILKVGTGAHHALYIIRDTEEDDIEELEEYDVLDQEAIEYAAAE